VVHQEGGMGTAGGAQAGAQQVVLGTGAVVGGAPWECLWGPPAGRPRGVRRSAPLL